MNRFSPIDPDSLAPLTLVEVPDKEAIISARIAQVVSVWSSYDPPYAAQYDVGNLEFDPIRINQEVSTSFEINALTLINKMAQATSLATTFGANMDQIGSTYPGGVPRLQIGFDTFDVPIYEKDSRYRYRIWLSSNAFTTAGAELAYVFEAMTFDGQLRDVTANIVRDSFDQEPTVVVVCLDGPAVPEPGEDVPAYDPTPDSDRLLALRSHLSDPGISPLSDVISTVAATILPVIYDVGLWLYPNADADTALALVRDAIGVDEDGTPLPYAVLPAVATDGVVEAPEDANLKDRMTYIGVDHTLMELLAACNQVGVEAAEPLINGLVSDLLIDEFTCGMLSSANVHVLGYRQ